MVTGARNRVAVVQKQSEYCYDVLNLSSQGSSDTQMSPL